MAERRRWTTWGLLLALPSGVLAGCLSDPSGSADGGADGGRPSTIGSAPYDGPRDATGLANHCGGGGTGSIPCYLETLKAYLLHAGSIPAFALLDDLASVDPAVNTESHVLGHELGRYALAAYGTIGLTLTECSYEASQGCVHGALQAHFEALSSVVPADYVDICPTETRLKEHACLHGLGHGFVLYHQYDVPAALSRCDGLPTEFARTSCHGGAFMENMVAYMDHQSALQAIGHHHGAANVTYMIDPDDPYFPCNGVRANYQDACWRLQTSLMLFLNHQKGFGQDENFKATAEACRDAPAPHPDTCHRSLGRDASAYANTACAGRANACHVKAVGTWCASADASGRAMCNKGAVAEVVLNFADPEPGLRMCELADRTDKVACYEELGTQASLMLDRSGLESLCNRSEREGQDACRRGAGLA